MSRFGENVNCRRRARTHQLTGMANKLRRRRLSSKRAHIKSPMHFERTDKAQTLARTQAHLCEFGMPSFQTNRHFVSLHYLRIYEN